MKQTTDIETDRRALYRLIDRETRRTSKPKRPRRFKPQSVAERKRLAAKLLAMHRP